MFRRESFTWLIVFAALVTAISGCRGVRDGEERLELSPGEYDLVAVVPGSQPREESRGRLSLRAYAGDSQPAGSNMGYPLSGQQMRGIPYMGYPLYGWTSVDFIKLGAPLGESATPESKDPDNPGVLVWSPDERFKGMQEQNAFKVARPWNAPVMLIGTLRNNKATRGWLDGGGIALYVQSKRGRCFNGEWSSWGIRLGRNLAGSFTVCPVR